MRVCDGCGAEVDEAHIRRRIERLEMATRFRPIHIQVLLLGDAPPTSTEDYFYRIPVQGETRSAGGNRFAAEMMAAAGITSEEVTNAESALADFQRCGFYLADAVECPVTPEELDERVSRLAPTIIKRIAFSYRPKYVAVVGVAAHRLIPVLKKSAIGEKLVTPESRESTSGTRAITGEEIATTLMRLMQ